MLTQSKMAANIVCGSQRRIMAVEVFVFKLSENYIVVNFVSVELEFIKGPIYYVLQTTKTPGGKCFYCLQSLQKPHPSSDWIMALIAQFQIQ